MRLQLDSQLLLTRRDLRRLRQLQHFEQRTKRELDRLGAGDAQYVALAEMVAALAAQDSLTVRYDYRR